MIPKTNAAKTGEAGEKLKQSIVVGHIRGEERSHRCFGVLLQLHCITTLVVFLRSFSPEERAGK